MKFSAPVRVNPIVACSSFLATPKSPSLKSPNSLTKMFSGLISLWTIRRAAHTESARQRSVPSLATSFSDISFSAIYFVRGVSSSIRIKMFQAVLSVCS